MNIFSLNLTKKTDELKKLIAEYPDYPIVVLAGECACNGDFLWTYCSSITFMVSEVLDCLTPFNEEVVYNDRGEFNIDLEQWLWDACGGNDTPPKITDKEFEERYRDELEKYEPYWKKVIAIKADN